MTLAIIGGTGFDKPQILENPRFLNISTSWGPPSAQIIEGLLGGRTVLFLARHGRKLKYPPHKINYRANIAALHKAGASAIIATAAVGGIGIDPGTIVIPNQIIDYTYNRDSTFYEGGSSQLKHIDFTTPYDAEIRKRLIDAALASSVNAVDSGIYGATQGPRLETAAEIQKLKNDGCTIVGMTGMPEACLAKELEIPYATIALVINSAAGLSTGEISFPDLEKELVTGCKLWIKVFKSLKI